MIPVCEPTIQGNEVKYVTDAVQSGWISSAGSYIKKLEQGFADYCGVTFGASCTSGTTALHLAVEALDIGKGDEVILPSFTMIGSCNAIMYAGATPVLVDSELDTWNIDPSKIEEKITKKTKAIMVVHTYGHPCDMDSINAIAKKHNLFVIEDAAEAHGAEYKSKKCGVLGDIACFSFYANKNMSTGEGGMVVTNNEQWHNKMQSLKNHCLTTPRFLHHELGYNYRMTNVQAAIGCAQLEYLDKLVGMRIKNAQEYTKQLSSVQGITTPPQASWAKNVYWMYGILIGEEFGLDARAVQEQLLKKGVDTRTFFIGMHKQPVYKQKRGNNPRAEGSFDNAELLEQNGFYLPSSSHLTKEQITQVVTAIKEIKDDSQ